MTTTTQSDYDFIVSREPRDPLILKTDDVTIVYKADEENPDGAVQSIDSLISDGNAVTDTGDGEAMEVDRIEVAIPLAEAITIRVSALPLAIEQMMGGLRILGMDGAEVLITGAVKNNSSATGLTLVETEVGTLHLDPDALIEVVERA